MSYGTPKPTPRNARYQPGKPQLPRKAGRVGPMARGATKHVDRTGRPTTCNVAVKNQGSMPTKK